MDDGGGGTVYLFQVLVKAFFCNRVSLKGKGIKSISPRFSFAKDKFQQILKNVSLDQSSVYNNLNCL